jgi:DNA-binding SARP family transcriptional activator
VVRFRVLGATELVADGVTDGITSERQRRLLAALAMRAPSPVPTESLLEAVWGERRPANGLNALQTVATRLRHSLDAVEPGLGERVAARAPGYALDVAPGEIDAHRFADLATAGRRHLAEGDVAAATSTLDEALGLWRGDPYAEFADEPWAQGESTRLSRLAVAVREAAIEARMECGLHGEVLGEIQQLIDDEPYSEGPRDQLMRAMFATGRHPSADSGRRAVR